MEGNTGGLYYFDYNSPDKLKQITPENIKKPEMISFDLNYCPAYSDKLNALAFEYQYGIELMNFDERIATKIYKNNSSGAISFIMFFHNSEKLLLIQGNALMIIDIYGKNLETIPLEINEWVPHVFTKQP